MKIHLAARAQLAKLRAMQLNSNFDKEELLFLLRRAQMVPALLLPCQPPNISDRLRISLSTPENF